MNGNGVLSFQLTPIVEEGLHAPHLVDYANTLGPASRGAPSQRNRGRCQHGFGPPYIISQSKTKEMDLTRPSLNLFFFFSVTLTARLLTFLLTLSLMGAKLEMN